jgi:hypothetical protein
MNRPNNNRNQRNDESRRRLLISNKGNGQDDDSRSQVDSESSEEQRSSASEEESAPFMQSENDAEDYVKRLRKAGTADVDVTTSALKSGATILAAKAGIAYLARFGALGNKDDAADEAMALPSSILNNNK